MSPEVRDTYMYMLCRTHVSFFRANLTLVHRYKTQLLGSAGRFKPRINRLDESKYQSNIHK
jgi:hypothetical protein